MGKSCVFAPIIIFFVIFGALIFGFFRLIFKLVKKGRNDAWVGIVQDKKYVEKTDKDIGEKIGHKEHLYSLAVKLENGEVHNIAVSREFYDSCQLGDKLKKEKGKLWPEKV